MKCMKMTLSLLLCLALALGCSAPAFADDGAQAPTVGNVDVSDAYSVDGPLKITVGGAAVTGTTPNVGLIPATDSTPTTVNVNANIDADSVDGLFVNAFYHSVNINVGEQGQPEKGGDITAGGNYGIYAEAEFGNEVHITAAGTVKGCTEGVSAAAGNISGKNTLTVTVGDVTASNPDKNTIGIGASACAESTTTVSAASVKSGGEGIVVSSSACFASYFEPEENNGIVTLGVEGDVTAAGDGVCILDAMGTVTVTVGGTLTAGENGAPIKLEDEVSAAEAGNIDVTVWKIEGGNGGDIVQGGGAAEGDGKSAAQTVQENINYSIRIKDDNDSKTAFSGYSNSNGVETLHAGRQQIRVSVSDGYKLYATDGTGVEITKADDGYYYAEIPIGGGIFLNAVPVQSSGGPSGKNNALVFPLGPDGAPSVEVTYATVEFCFDLDGGTTADGETQLRCLYFPGQTVKLPAAPQKDGFSFGGWQTEIDGETVVFRPGEQIKVTGAMSFTALWIEN